MTEPDSAHERPTPAQQAEAKAYGRRQLYCTVADMALDLGYLVLFTLVLALAADRWLASFAWLQNHWLRLAVFFLLLNAGQTVVSFPLAFYAGYVLEHQYQLSRQTFLRWLGRYALQHLLAAALGLALIEGLFLVVYWTGPAWWIVAAIASFAVTVLLGQLVPVLILPLFYKIERLENEELLARFQRLASGTGLTIEGVYRMRLSRETVKANAMLAGLGRTRRVILGDTLLDGFTPDEIEVVLAHEVGHHVYRHIIKFLAGGFLFSCAAFFLCDLVLRWQVARYEGALDYTALPVWTLAWILLTVGLFSTGLGPLHNALSRRFERQCDRYALERTDAPHAFRSAFHKLAVLNKADLHPHPLEVFLLHDHPPIAERLALAGPDSSHQGA